MGMRKREKRKKKKEKEKEKEKKGRGRGRKRDGKRSESFEKKSLKKNKKPFVLGPLSHKSPRKTI